MTADTPAASCAVRMETPDAKALGSRRHALHSHGAEGDYCEHIRGDSVLNM